MTTYEKRKAEGRCPVCGGAREDRSHVICAACRQKAVGRKRKLNTYERMKQAERTRELYRRNREAGLCSCGRERMDGYACCDVCRNKHKKRYNTRKEAGLCVDCAMLIEDGKHVLCAMCREKRRRYAENRNGKGNEA